MTVLKGPLFSISAKGHFSRDLTFYSHLGRSYTMIQRNRRGLFVGKIAGFGRMPFGTYLFGYSGRLNDLNNSQAQILQRSLFSACWLAYAQLTTPQKLELDIEAKVLQMSGANLFMSRYLKENN